MKKSTTSHASDPLAIVGDYWSLRILLALKDAKELRFCGMQRELDDLNPVTLTNRLKRLEEARIIDRFDDPESKLGVCYRLNGNGTKLLPVLTEVEKLLPQK